MLYVFNKKKCIRILCDYVFGEGIEKLIQKRCSLLIHFPIESLNLRQPIYN